jgi:hypothetical protein
LAGLLKFLNIASRFSRLGEPFCHPFFTAAKFGIAQMAELVDASDSKSGTRKGVQVRFLFWAPNHETRSDSGFRF